LNCILKLQREIFSSGFIQLLERRQIGRERIAEYLEGVTKSEFYIRAAQRPQPLAKNPSDLLVDYQFTKYFKGLESTFKFIEFYFFY
jgi:hypothetical protein